MGADNVNGSYWDLTCVSSVCEAAFLKKKDFTLMRASGKRLLSCIGLKDIKLLFLGKKMDEYWLFYTLQSK